MNLMKALFLVFCSASIFSCATTSREYLVKSGTFRREFTVNRDYKELFSNLGKRISDCYSKPFRFPGQHKKYVDLALNGEKKIGTIDLLMETLGTKNYLAVVEVENKDQKVSTVRVYAGGSGWSAFADHVSVLANDEKAPCR